MYKNQKPIRLVGLRVSDLTDNTYEQVSLFDEVGKSNKRNKVQKALDSITDEEREEMMEYAVEHQPTED